MDTIQQLRSLLSGLPGAPNFKHVKEKIFLRRQSGCYLDTPTAGHHVLVIGAENFVEVLAPKKFPHAPEFRILRQRGSLRRLEGPTLARSPCSAVVIAGREEFVPLAAPPGHDAFPG